MTQIKIEVPANDHIALSAMADALQRIATERAPQELTPSEMGNSQPSVTDMVKSEIERRSNLGVHADKVFDKLKPTLNEQTLAEFKTPDKAFEDLQREAFKTPDSAVDVELSRLDEEFEESVHIENTKHDEAFEEAVTTKVDVNGTEYRQTTGILEEVEVTCTLSDSTLDADGIPHDKRIHSKGATRLADNTWRLRKRPADKTEEEWTTYIDSVKAELKAVQDIPSVEPEKLNDIDVAIGDIESYAKAWEEHSENLPEGMKQGEPCTQGDIDRLEAHLTPPVIEEPATQLEGVTPNGDVAIEPPVTVGAPVAPVTPPTSLTPPVTETDKPSVTTFQELMLYMTSDAKKRGADNDLIKATLLEVDPALTAIPLIATRADLIPKFVTALEAKLK